MEILFVRHGETEWNNNGKIQGGTDIPLNDKGLGQAASTRALFNGNKPDLIVCSPLLRALQTAKIIAEGRNIPIYTDERLRERNYGSFEGRHFSEVDFSGIWFPGGAEPTGIEPLSAFCERIAAAFRDLAKNYAGKTVLVVSHGGVSIAASILINKTPQNKNSKELYIDNCTVMRYDISSL